MKKILLTFTISLILLTGIINLTSANTELPKLPMSLWGEFKNNSQDIPIGTEIRFYDTINQLIGEYSTVNVGQYGRRGPLGGDIGFIKSISKIQISNDNGISWNNITMSGDNQEISRDSSNPTECQINNGIIAFAEGEECKFNININTIKPIANFNINSSYLTASFIDQSLNNPTNWSWDFGDGNTSIAKNPTHTYSQSGTYNVKLTVSNIGGSHEINSSVSVVSYTPSSSSGGGGGGGGSSVSCKSPVLDDFYPLRNKITPTFDTIKFSVSSIAKKESIKTTINKTEIDLNITENDDNSFSVEGIVPEIFKTEKKFVVVVTADSKSGCTRTLSYTIQIGEISNSNTDYNYPNTTEENKTSNTQTNNYSSGIDYSNYPAYQDMMQPWGLHWSNIYVGKLKDLGILSSQKSNFEPDKVITRAEILKLVVESKYTQEEINSCLGEYIHSGWDYVFFPDANKDYWYAKYICMGKVKGIINGYKDGTIRPDSPVTRAEGLKMIIESSEKGNPELCMAQNVNKDWDYIFFKDVDKIAWYGKYICEAKTRNYVDGSNEIFKPNDYITRAESAKLTVNIFNF